VAAILDQLSARGMRRTSARQAILEAFFAAESHVTAEDIAAEVHRRFPSVDVSTVYRTLDRLERDGVLQRLGCIVYEVSNRALNRFWIR